MMFEVLVAMNTYIKNIGIIATICIGLFFVGNSVFAYSIDSYVKQVEEDISKGLDTFQNNTQYSESDLYKIDIVKKAMGK